jgi:hypothetical protein
MFAHMKGTCTQEQMESCTYMLEIKSGEPGEQWHSLFNSACTRNLLKHICSRAHTRSILILRTWTDISSEPSPLALFQQICRNMNVTVKLLPQLPSQL